MEPQRDDEPEQPEDSIAEDQLSTNDAGESAQDPQLPVGKPMEGFEPSQGTSQQMPEPANDAEPAGPAARERSGGELEQPAAMGAPSTDAHLDRQVDSTIEVAPFADADVDNLAEVPQPWMHSAEGAAKEDPGDSDNDPGTSFETSAPVRVSGNTESAAEILPENDLQPVLTAGPSEDAPSGLFDWSDNRSATRPAMEQLDPPSIESVLAQGWFGKGDSSATSPVDFISVPPIVQPAGPHADRSSGWTGDPGSDQSPADEPALEQWQEPPHAAIEVSPAFDTSPPLVIEATVSHLEQTLLGLAEQTAESIARLTTEEIDSQLNLYDHQLRAQLRALLC